MQVKKEKKKKKNNKAKQNKTKTWDELYTLEFSSLKKMYTSLTAVVQIMIKECVITIPVITA